MKKIIIFILFIFISQGCSYKYGDIAFIGTKNIDFSKPYVRGETKVSGVDISKIFVIIPNKMNPMIDDALKNALKDSCAEYLTDAKITLNMWYIPYIYGETKFKIEGYPWYERGKNKNSCKF